MPRHEGTLPPAYFDRLYATDADPWRFASSEYERDKYAASLAALQGRRYRSGFEIGCSIGVFSRALAGACGNLLAVDVAEAALAQARRRCADRAQVRFERMRVPDEWPVDARFDLIVLSEVVYYLSPADIVRLGARILAALEPGGDMLLVHWTGETDYPVSGDAATELLFDAVRPSLRVSHQRREPAYRLDLLRRD